MLRNKPVTYLQIFNESFEEGDKMFGSSYIARNGLGQKIFGKCYLLSVRQDSPLRLEIAATDRIVCTHWDLP